MEFVSGQIAIDPYWYLAAPFFNPTQVSLVKMIEGAFEQSRTRLFSPRLQHRDKDFKIDTVEKARQVFDMNAAAIRNCCGMLAVVDWAMEEDTQLRAMRKNRAVGPPLHLPDTGTVWEMGAAYGFDKPVVIFTERTQQDKLNVMLTQGANGVLYGTSRLVDWLDSGGIAEHLAAWKGAHQ